MTAEILLFISIKNNRSCPYRKVLSVRIRYDLPYVKSVLHFCLQYFYRQEVKKINPRLLTGVCKNSL